MPDRDLDELFKTAVDNVQYDFEQAAWQDLQRKMRGGWWSRKGVYWGSGLLLLLGTTLTVLWLNQPQKLTPNDIQASPLSHFSIDRNIQKIPDQTDQLFQQRKNSIQNTDAPQGSTQNAPLQNTASVLSTTTPGSINRTPAYVNKSNIQPGTVKHSSKNTNPLQIHKQLIPTKSGQPKVVANIKKPGYQYKDIFDPKVKQADDQKNDPRKGDKLGANRVNKGIGSPKQTTSQKDKNKVIFAPTRSKYKIEPVESKHSPEQPAFLPPIAQKTVVLSVNENQAQNQRPAQRLSLIVQVAPDLSMVDQMSLNNTRLGFGLLAEYEIIKNLSISTGAHYSFKAYQASAESYTPKNGEWRWPESPESIEATCNVLEVPLNIRYYFHNQPKHRLFISSGISSYWMLNESYSYMYPSRTQWNYSWQLNHQNQHLFSILNLSIGWQKKLNNRFSIQAEPFLKLPLGKVGGGQVDLKTTGILLGLKYNLF